MKTALRLAGASALLATVGRADYHSDSEDYSVQLQGGAPEWPDDVNMSEYQYIATGGAYAVTAEGYENNWLITGSGSVNPYQLGGSGEVTIDPPGGTSITYTFSWGADAPFTLYAEVYTYTWFGLDCAEVQTDPFAVWQSFWINRGGPNYYYTVDLGDADVWWFLDY